MTQSTHLSQSTTPRLVREDVIPEFGVRAPGTSATSGFRAAVIRVIGGIAEEEAAVTRFGRHRQGRA